MLTVEKDDVVSHFEAIEEGLLLEYEGKECS